MIRPAAADSPPPDIMRASNFYSKFGINPTLDLSPQDNISWINYLGLSLARIFILNHSQSQVDAFANSVSIYPASGIRVLVDIESGGTANPLYGFHLMSDYIAALKRNLVIPYPGKVVGVTGPSEINIASITGYNFAYTSDVYGGLSGVAAANQVQADLYAGMKADPDLQSIPVYMWPVGWWPSLSEDDVGDQTAHCDAANLHDYYSVDPSGPFSVYTGTNGTIAEVMQKLMLPSFRSVCNREHFVSTETGWPSNMYGAWGDYIQARYILRDLFEHARLPYNDYVFIFTLLGAPYDLDYGMINRDNSPKLSAAAIHNLMPLLRDTGDRAGSFDLSPFPYSISGMLADSQDCHFALEKSDGHVMILLWNNAKIWDAESESRIAVSPRNVTIGLPRSMSGYVYDVINNGQAAIASFNNQSQVSVSLGDAPLVIDSH
jgi:hypothetical protein